MFAEYQYNVFCAKREGKDSALIPRPKLINVPNDLPERTKGAAQKYQPIFDYLKNAKIDFATGDTSSSSAYSLPPYNVINLVTHIGGSVSLAIGAYLSGFKNVWALTGDFGFISACCTILIGSCTNNEHKYICPQRCQYSCHLQREHRLINSKH